ncbi:MAG: DUF1501 domain-containing protein [Verrucomicrobiales bacterium]|nr:DUF1501 domain-containing protein [Verrucomicrobiales bacterium]
MNTGSLTSRRDFLQRASGGFGAVALAGLWDELQAATDPLAAGKGHHPARADRVIFIFSTGGVSQVDTFDHKPQLTRDHGKSITATRWLNKSGSYERFLVKSRWGFKPYGRSGTMVSDLFPHIGTVIDDICVLNAMHCDSDGHDKATLAAHTGSAQFARPSAGAWVSYGLGTENRNLPSFMVLAPAAPYAGAQTWGSDFLPACHQGTHVVPGPEPLPNLKPGVKSPALQELELSLLGKLNRAHLDDRRSADLALDARIRSFETAFGMQREAPEAFDLSGESDATLALYGLQRGATTGFGWQCLVARRLAERGVRFLELIDVGSSSNWDSHGNMADHERLARAIDQPIAGLITDLKQRGLLERTLVVWTTEFGRTPFHQKADHPGREHHNLVFSSWMAGGGVKGGYVHGKSDEHGILPAEGAVHTHDLHATMLHLLGIDHEKLTYRHAGRDFRLTDIAGEVVRPILA